MIAWFGGKRRSGKDAGAARVRKGAKPTSRRPAAERAEAGSKVRSGNELLVDRGDLQERHWRSVAVVAGLILALPVGAGLAAVLAPQDSAALVYEAGAELAELSAASGLAIDAVTVEGRKRTDVEDLRDAIGINRGDPILFLDLEEVRQRIKALPWVKTAIVQRRLPDALHVSLEEREPFVRWQSDGQTMVIDREGAILAPDAGGEYRHLRRLVGLGAPQQGTLLFDILQGDAELFARVAAAARIRDRRWDVIFDNGVVLRLPEEGARQAWERFARLQATEGLLDKDVRAIDLRVPDRVILELTPEAVQTRLVPGKNT